MRKQNIVVLAVLVFSFVGSLFGQERTRAYLVSPDLIGIVKVVDPESPISIYNERVLIEETGPLSRAYTVKNRSRSPIVSFQIREISWLGGQESIFDSNLAKDQRFLPNESFSTFSPSDGIEISAFDERLRTHAAFRNRPKDIWLIVVTRVETADGEIYDGSSPYRQLVEFVKALDVSFEDSAEQIRRKEEALQSYLNQAFIHDPKN